MHIIIVYRKGKPEAGAMAYELKRMVREYGYEAEIVEAYPPGPDSPLNCDYLVVLGGDGTILASIHALEEPETPVLAITYGRGGYLADATPGEAMSSVKSLLVGSYRLERFMRIDVHLDGEYISDAVNEAYVSNRLAGKVVEFDLEVERLDIKNIVADGMVFSTPVGSTGYNTSLGGPLVDEELELIIASPVAPITNIRPLIFSPLRKLMMRCRQGPFCVVIDGFVRREFERGELEVTKSRRSTVLVRTSEVTLYERRIKKRLGI